MTTAPARPEQPALELDRIRTAPLDRLRIADVSGIVRRVVGVHRDESRITAAKFSSSL